MTVCSVVWWQLYNFLVVQVKFNRFLHSNEHPKWILCYLVRLFDVVSSKIGHHFTNKFSSEWFIFKRLSLKVVLLIGYSVKEIIFMKIQLNSGLQSWLWKLKMSNFWQSLIKRPDKISKNSFRRLIQMQKSIEFQLHHWEILQLSAY